MDKSKGSINAKGTMYDFVIQIEDEQLGKEINGSREDSEVCGF